MLNNCYYGYKQAVLNCLLGTQDVDQIIKAIVTASQALQSKQVATSPYNC